MRFGKRSLLLCSVLCNSLVFTGMSQAQHEMSSNAQGSQQAAPRRGFTDAPKPIALRPDSGEGSRY